MLAQSSIWVAIIITIIIAFTPNFGITQPSSFTSLDEFVVPVATDESNRAADEGMKRLKRLAAKKGTIVRDLGFRSVDEVEHARVHMEPFGIVFVDFEKIKELKPVESRTKVLFAANRFLYPVMVDGVVRSAITVTRLGASEASKGTWRPTRWGSSGLIRRLMELRNNEKTGSRDFVLAFPGVNLYFLGVLIQNEFKIIPVVDDPRNNFVAGKELSPDFVFEAITRYKPRGSGAG